MTFQTEFGSLVSNFTGHLRVSRMGDFSRLCFDYFYFSLILIKVVQYQTSKNIFLPRPCDIQKRDLKMRVFGIALGLKTVWHNPLRVSVLNFIYVNSTLLYVYILYSAGLLKVGYLGGG